MTDKQPYSLWSPFQQYTETFLNNPWTNWHRFFNPILHADRSYHTELFPVTVEWKNADDVGVERHVLEQVGSYGRQLSIMLDLLDVLATRLEPASVRSRERDVLDRFYDLIRQVDRAVADFEGEPVRPRVWRRTDVEDLIATLEDLRARDPELQQQFAERLKAALE